MKDIDQYTLLDTYKIKHHMLHIHINILSKKYVELFQLVCQHKYTVSNT